MRKSSKMAVAAVGTLALLGGSVFVASTIMAASGVPDAEGVIHGCYDSSGKLRVVSTEADCRANETAIAWSQTGPKGDQGAPGPSDAYIARGGGVVGAGAEKVIVSLTVPAGSYVVHGKTGVRPAPATQGQPNNELGFGFCQTIDGSGFDFRGDAGPDPRDILTMVEATTFSATTTIEMTCFTSAGQNNGALFEDAKIVAVKVGTLH